MFIYSNNIFRFLFKSSSKFTFPLIFNINPFSFEKKETKYKDNFSSRIITKIILIVLLNCSVNLFPQIVSDFSIADSGSVPSVTYDLNGGIYVTWQNLKDAIYLKHLDAMGNTNGSTIKFSNTFASIFPRIAVSSINTIVVWEDRLSNIVSFFKSYIIGNISPNNTLAITQIAFIQELLAKKEIIFLLFLGMIILPVALKFMEENLTQMVFRRVQAF
ncbi:MAG: hypothetical protein ACYCVH_13550 [Ignavibacteriaceae bacterium]